MEKQEIQNWIDQGYLHARVILEMLGKPKEHIEKTMQDYVNNIAENKNIKLISKEIAEAKEQEIPSGIKIGENEKVWSTFTEMEFMIKGISKLVGFCFDYMPSSIEILAPEKIVFNLHTITDFVNDLQAKLHKMDAVLKNQNNENMFLKRNMHITLQNLILISLHYKNLDEESLSKITGIPQEGLKPFIESLLKDNKIKKNKNLYMLV